MLRFIKNTWNKIFGKKSNGLPVVPKIKKFNFSIGESEIHDDYILIKNYPYGPSSIFPNKKINHAEISEIHLDSYPPTIKIQNELIFISRNNIEALKEFAKKNKIKTTRRNNNWSLLTEPFLDNEFDEQQKNRTAHMLETNGVPKKEIDALRREIAEPMRRYNFETMLWEWGDLSLQDVLSAMQVAYGEKEFEMFYWKAMEVEIRGEFSRGSHPSL